MWTQLLFETGSRRVALTFDDGPNGKWTAAIGDLLHSRGVRGTFFQVGRAVRQQPQVSRRLVSQGHEIGNHSWSHLWPKCLSASLMLREIDRTQQIMNDLVDAAPHLYRPPWLLRTPGLLPGLTQRGLQPVLGTFVHPWEPYQVPARWIVRKALHRLTPDSTLIFHDGFDGCGGPHPQTVLALKLLLDQLLHEGWSCVTVSDLNRRS